MRHNQVQPSRPNERAESMTFTLSASIMLPPLPWIWPSLDSENFSQDKEIEMQSAGSSSPVSSKKWISQPPFS